MLAAGVAKTPKKIIVKKNIQKENYLRVFSRVKSCLAAMYYARMVWMAVALV